MPPSFEVYKIRMCTAGIGELNHIYEVKIKTRSAYKSRVGLGKLEHTPL